MKLFISVVNHHHDDLISNSDTLKSLAKQHEIIIKSNTTPNKALTDYCQESRIHLLTSAKNKGFGANNNEVFSYAQTQLKMKERDYFLVLNPDVIIENEQINHLLSSAKQFNSDISAINLYKDINKSISDNSIRYYHSLLNPIKSLLGFKRNDIFDKSITYQPTEIDWAAGSFLLFKTSCYKLLGGFNEKYFMYFEDADICTRANKKGFKVMYFPKIEAIHLAAHSNRSFLSKHFRWYLRSLVRYHLI